MNTIGRSQKRHAKLFRTHTHTHTLYGSQILAMMWGTNKMERRKKKRLFFEIYTKFIFCVKSPFQFKIQVIVKMVGRSPILNFHLLLINARFTHKISLFSINSSLIVFFPFLCKGGAPGPVETPWRFLLEAKIAVTFVGDRTLERQGRPESHEGKKGQKDQKGRGMPTELGG